MKAAKTYWLPILLITCWWSLAFRHNAKSDGSVAQQNDASRYSISSITLIKRDQLKTALAGDVEMMTTLIADWDIEAQLLQQMKSDTYARISSENFLRSQIIGRHLRLAKETHKGREPTQMESYLIHTAAEKKRYLPQTYAAASLLLALTDPEEIVALPEMMRSQTQLFPKELTAQIPLDVNRYNSEKLFLMAPTIAFVANYSQPTTIQAFKDQGIVLYTLGNLNTIMEVSKEIRKIGNIIERPQKAELLTIFIEAAMCAIDNQLKVLTEKIMEKQNEIPRVLFLNHFQHFSVPSPTSLTGQLLERIALFDITLEYAAKSAPADKWVVPIGKEQIVNLNPDCIIIVTEERQAIEEEIRKEATLKDVVAVKNNKIFFLDDAIQLSPTQYTVLAYQDLIEALARLL